MVDKHTPNKLCSLALGLEEQQRTLEADEIDVTEENIHVNSSDFAGSDDDVMVESLKGLSSDWSNDDSEDEDYNIEDENNEHDHGTVDPNDKTYQGQMWEKEPDGIAKIQRWDMFVNTNRHDVSYEKLAHYIEMIKLTNLGSRAYINWDSTPLQDAAGSYDVAITFGVVESKNIESWKHFFSTLVHVVGAKDHGVVHALKECLLDASRRVCIVHLERNMKRNFLGSDMKELLWKAANACTSWEHEAALDEFV
ncbi:hypothetical protein Cgig2_023583 [Carnegiea gigantea]|uniref:Uncharacterized protein n=1 Tax=Carnegiea gigantea TaxID=171969 RepID=A0A9Q1JQX4_9CARY|nr:hypothetical protein Cgig2_023583 [Carnegiea gigantea]